MSAQSDLSIPISTSTQSMQPLYSEFADDPEMSDLVDLFIAELDERIKILEQTFTDHDLEQLCQLAHQLKGAGGGYGFMPITDSAAQLEQQIKTQQAMDNIEQSFRELVNLCRRATNGSPK